ncbi:MAG: hypothetical protein LBR29_07640 [Methylobacteriaceae bacterium]|jgi:hypothetical protein|nr:hypothetical protein [Methylobacteriaceae bacterium]
MDSLPTVTIDPGVLAVPRSDCTKDDAYRYVETLLDWCRLLKEPWLTVCMSEQASNVLIAEELFPLRNHLRELFNEHGIAEYTVNDIAVLAEKLLSLEQSFESYHRVEDVLTDHVETVPDVIRLIAHDCLQTNLQRCVTLIAVLRKHCAQPLGGHSLILKQAPERVIQVRACIHDLEHSRDDIPPLPCSPEFFEGDVLVCDSFSGLIECLDEAAILAGAQDDVGIELAIRIALYKSELERGGTPEWSNMIAPALGAKFRETCQRICDDHGESVPPKILRAIEETANKRNLQAVHALRTRAGGDARQRTRGFDRAQRRDIDRGFHLHYWDRADGAVELASVVYHDDFSIPE